MPRTGERKMSMKKVKILGVLVAALAFSAIAVAGASATLWLKNGVSLTKEEPADAHGELVLHHTGGFGGTILILCTGLTHGFVGPGAKDKTTSVEGLNKELNTVECLVHTGNLGCPAGTKVSVKADGLPWETELLLNGTLTEDDLVGTGGVETGYTTTCNGISIKCDKNEKSHFASNLANGALFEFLGTNEAACSDGGKGTILGMGEVLGFTVS